MPLPRIPRLPTRTAVAAVVSVLVLANLLDNRWAGSWILLTAVLTSAVLVGLLFWSGGGWPELGLGRCTAANGARWGAALIGIVAAVYLCAALLPVTRGLFADQRTNALSGSEITFKALVAVPVGTVLLEETAFRGVLFALLCRLRTATTAAVLSSVLFGLWHILPSLNLNKDKPLLGSLFGHSVAGAVLVDVGAVLFTAVAGCLLCWVRDRSGSLLAPMALHWAVNALGYAVGFLLR
ncbi:CPBP family intramembrane glutamic endopeptidase [Streptomyces sp. Ag109_O5-10]|uniref:CPBP family intramembrane glutamic endopeptidase n=1 Tax=Streptomyces sp. Ag109_O5-10 TaxID=1855349 RepID=UPI00089A2DE0|nr:CPBP family intramembrane glutamic endopeptidase [Streptomyces sp. Ag109_O5-10]SED90058.1 CAAX protease self-immunity [Streptomyces sp. Ag109_O5-10]